MIENIHSARSPGTVVRTLVPLGLEEEKSSLSGGWRRNAVIEARAFVQGFVPFVKTISYLG